jgi:hypothetical protein
VLPLKAHPRQLIATVFEAVFHRPGSGSERNMTAALIERLCEQNIGLIADEVHHVGLAGAQQLRYLWDQAARFATPFPLLLVGCNVDEQLSKAEEVRGRIARWVHFHTLEDPQDLIAIAAALHPRLAATSEVMLDKINRTHARRSIRAWQQIAKHIDLLPSTASGAKKVEPVTAADMRLLATMIGTR